MTIEPNPDNVLIKVTQDEWAKMFSVKVKREDGSEVDLFRDVEEMEGYERRVKQNVSVGTIIAVGSNLKGIIKGDIAIIDYLVTGTDDAIVGYHKGAKLISIPAVTTYHTQSAPPYIDGRRAWVTGDIDTLSPLLGIVRMKKAIAFHPYIFLVHEPPTKIRVAEGGMLLEESKEICSREVISASPNSGYNDGDRVVLKEQDLFTRIIDNKKISVIFESDVLFVTDKK